MGTKNSLRLACDYIVKLDSSIPSNASDIQPKYCKGNCKSKSHEECLNCAMQYFGGDTKEQDGWDVVKEIRQTCVDERLIPNHEEDNFEAGFNAAKDDVIDFIDSRLGKADI